MRPLREVPSPPRPGPWQRSALPGVGVAVQAGGSVHIRTWALLPPWTLYSIKIIFKVLFYDGVGIQMNMLTFSST